MFRVIENENDGTLNINKIIEEFKNDTNFGHYNKTGLVCIEDTNNACGGVSLPYNYIK